MYHDSLKQSDAHMHQENTPSPNCCKAIICTLEGPILNTNNFFHHNWNSIVNSFHSNSIPGYAHNGCHTQKIRAIDLLEKQNFCHISIVMKKKG